MRCERLHEIIAVFAPNATGDVDPVRYIQWTAPPEGALLRSWSSGKLAYRKLSSGRLTGEPEVSWNRGPNFPPKTGMGITGGRECPPMR